jgi:hypothetical protein
MSRSIDARLRKLERKLVPPSKPVRVHLFAADSNEEADAEIARLVSIGEASLDDEFIQLVAGKWEEANSSAKDDCE